jgi:hypothetical protein
MDAESEAARLKARIEDGTLPRYEPLFVLRAQDVLAADVVRIWASLAESRGVPAEKVREAMQLAAAMKCWPVKQVPGRPKTKVTIHGDGPFIESLKTIAKAWLAEHPPETPKPDTRNAADVIRQELKGSKAACPKCGAARRSFPASDNYECGRRIDSPSDYYADCRIAELTQKLSAAEAEKAMMWREIKGIIDITIPEACVVHVCEGGGPEDLLRTLCVSVTKTVERYWSEQHQRITDLMAERDLLAKLLETTSGPILPDGRKIVRCGEQWKVAGVGTAYPTLLEAIRAGMGTVDDDPLTSTTSPRPQ